MGITVVRLKLLAFGPGKRMKESGRNTVISLKGRYSSFTVRSTRTLSNAVISTYACLPFPCTSINARLSDSDSGIFKINNKHNDGSLSVNNIVVYYRKL